MTCISSIQPSSGIKVSMPPPVSISGSIHLAHVDLHLAFDLILPEVNLYLINLIISFAHPHTLLIQVTVTNK